MPFGRYTCGVQWQIVLDGGPSLTAREMENFGVKLWLNYMANTNEEFDGLARAILPTDILLWSLLLNITLTNRIVHTHLPRPVKRSSENRSWLRARLANDESGSWMQAETRSSESSATCRNEVNNRRTSTEMSSLPISRPDSQWTQTQLLLSSLSVDSVKLLITLPAFLWAFIRDSAFICTNGKYPTTMTTVTTTSKLQQQQLLLLQLELALPCCLNWLKD